MPQSKGSPVALQNNVPSDAMSLEANEIQLFSLNVESGNTGAQCAASTKNGDGWVSVEWGIEPFHGFPCTTASNYEPCILSYPGKDNFYDYVPILYALVRARDAMEDLTVTHDPFELIS